MLWSNGAKTYGKFSGVKYSRDSMKSTTLIFSSWKELDRKDELIKGYTFRNKISTL